MFSLIAELLFASTSIAANAKQKRRAEKCLADCEMMNTRFEQACKSKSPGGNCSGRGKSIVDDLDKRCKEECAKRKK